MKQTIKTGAMLLALWLMVGCGDGLHQPSNEEVKGGELVVNFSAVAMKKSLVEKGVVDINTTVYGYKAYKVPYTTTDEEGNEVKASGLFVIPPVLHGQVVPFGGLSMVSDDHGTIFANKEAPSVIADANGAPDGSAILLTSLGGFATLQPDYIGFGDSKEHYHPFVLKDSLANATVDFIKQVKVFAGDNNITLNNQLFLTGYSEGGYAAMATLKKIEEEALSDLSVSMAAPMAGPYALKAMADGVLSQAKIGVPSFIANVGYAYAKANSQAVNAIINEPYASKLPSLFNGDLDRTQIDPELTYDTTGSTGLFLSSFVNDYFINTTNWFREAMTNNNLHTWTPVSAVKLVHCEGDDVIPYAISQLTEGTMTAMGASSVSLIPVEKTLGLDINMTHGACATPAYQVTTGIFAQVRKATKGY
ncbi:MAG: Lysophospholipase (EC [uncultured Sulfurovum sp.]|uniref:Lysophospholipase (EC) n=1 Tax=uncultured Sulfurovum sp. TaxID=269237 RepID=A0A6S6TNT6_9BACT|nr:MAG: Lysophospholipase (EC [uncultured Sulfurovum sp.]